MRFKHTYLSFFILMFSSFVVLSQNDEKQKNIKLLSDHKTFVAGNPISLKFSNSKNNKLHLYCSNGYGSTLVSPIVENNVIQFQIPEAISNKSGMVSWKLLDDKPLLSGEFTISPLEKVASMETYIGPPSIEAGGSDYTMLVVIPTDPFDNPVKENTLVNIKHQFLSNEENDAVYTNNLIAYKKIFSQKESGRMLVASACMETNSKELTIDITAAIPTDFSIRASRPNNYADGNQITKFSTSVIKDTHNNIVSDGTYVEFFVTNRDGYVLKTSGTTIDGIAHSKMLHPDHEENWTVKAFISGMAKSNPIVVDYKQVINNFEVTFSENNRHITVGPLQSFMKQMIPDGLRVSLSVYRNQELLKSLIKTSNQGFVNFNLTKEIYEDGSYNIKIETAGLAQTFQSKSLW